MQRSIINALVLLFLSLSCSVEMQGQPQERVVLFGQQALEMVKQFGGKEQVVGIGYLDQKVKPGMQEEWPILTSLWPSIEALLATRPTHLFGMESAFKAKRSGSPAFWANKGIKTTAIFDFNQPRTLDVFLTDLRTFGSVFHKENEVEHFITQELNKLQQIKRQVPPAQQGQKTKRILFLANVRSSGIYYCYTQDKCLIGAMLQDFNVEFLTSENMVIPISLEYIVHLNPDYIILSSFQANSLPDLQRYFEEHPVLKQLAAVKNKQITTVDYSNAVSGGLEFVALYQQLTTFLYPNL